jgi:gluconolactonase
MHRFALGAIILVACSAGESDTDGDTPSFTGLPPANGGAGTGASAVASGGAGVGAAPGGQSMAPAANNGGPVGSAGSAAAGGSNEGNTNVGPLAPGSGGAGRGQTPPAGNAGSGEPPAQPDDPSEPAPGGPFVSRPVNGGASAAFVCPDGVDFGNPLDGMGAVQSVTAPSGSFFAFIEGPVWVGSLGRLFFSDNASGPERIWRLAPPSTTPEIFLPDSGSNGLALDNADQLLVADQSDQRITRVNSTTAARLGDVLPAGQHKPNDLIMRSDDNVYFTDPDSQGRGFYRVSPTGQLAGPFTQANAANGPNAPNGVELSPDENTLYVGDVQQRFVAKFPLLVDGAIDTVNGSVFVRTTGDTVDGMAVDCAGNLYVGTRTGVEVYAPDATFIGTVPTGESSNATFGGADRRTLFVTSRSTLKFVTLGVPGLPD